MLYLTRQVLRLCRRQLCLQNKCFNEVRTLTGTVSAEKDNKQSNSKDFSALLHKYNDKIKFNSYLEREKLDLGYYKYYLKNLKKRKVLLQKEYKEKSLPPLPISLRYYVDEERLLREENDTDHVEEPNDFQLPFGSATKVEYNNNKPSKPNNNVDLEKSADFDRSNIQKWMTNYEHFDDSQMTSDDDTDDELGNSWSKYYGTADPTANVSRVPCGGCGALLHCSDPSIPGYLPSEIFKNRVENELNTIECQRCHFLKEYNIALDVRVQPEEYEKLLQSIR